MSWRRYLPSAQFSVIAVSLTLSIGLVYAADLVTRKPTTAALAVANGTASATQDTDWKEALAEIQAQDGTSLPKPIDQASVNGMLAAAKSSNVTAAVGRTLLVNLTAAQSQGLGSDVPTQDQLIDQALSLVPEPQIKEYTLADLTLVPDSKEADHAYGNLLMATLNAHPGASMKDTLVVFANGVDSKKTADFQKFEPIRKEYNALVKDLALVPVPRTMSPLHLLVLNDLEQIAFTYPDMEVMLDDPALGLSALKRYKTYTDEASRVFINIAQSFNKEGILFTKDEPGATWVSVMSVQ